MTEKPSEAGPEDKHSRVLIGRDVRALRKSRNWTLAALADVVGCSNGYLSEVERGQRVVSIKFLRSIAQEFDLPLGWFFSHDDQPHDERGKIVRAQNRRRLGSSEEGLVEELLSPDLSGAFEMFLTQIKPGAKSNGSMSRDTEEEGYVITGQLDLTIGDHTFSLLKGDSFRIKKQTFSWVNSGDTDTNILWVKSPPLY